MGGRRARAGPDHPGRAGAGLRRVPAVGHGHPGGPVAEQAGSAVQRHHRDHPGADHRSHDRHHGRSVDPGRHGAEHDHPAPVRRAAGEGEGGRPARAHRDPEDRRRQDRRRRRRALRPSQGPWPLPEHRAARADRQRRDRGAPHHLRRAVLPRRRAGRGRRDHRDDRAGHVPVSRHRDQDREADRLQRARPDTRRDAHAHLVQPALLVAATHRRQGEARHDGVGHAAPRAGDHRRAGIRRQHASG